VLAVPQRHIVHDGSDGVFVKERPQRRRHVDRGLDVPIEVLYPFFEAASHLRTVGVGNHELAIGE
jgi:hypothetical protein